MIDQLTQTERLAFCAASSHEHDTEDDGPLCVTISRPVDGFRMPSREAVRLHDARLNHARRDSSGDFVTIGDSDEDKEQIETACFLPSARNRSAVSRELRSMGYAWND